jgi:hypothetical protein
MKLSYKIKSVHGILNFRDSDDTKIAKSWIFIKSKKGSIGYQEYIIEVTIRIKDQLSLR